MSVGKLSTTIVTALNNSKYVAGSTASRDAGAEENIRSKVANNLANTGTNFRRMIDEGLIKPEEYSTISIEERNKRVNSVASLFNEFVKSNETAEGLLKNTIISQMPNPAVEAKIMFQFQPSKQYRHYYNNPMMKQATIDHTTALQVLKAFSQEHTKITLDHNRIEGIFRGDFLFN